MPEFKKGYTKTPESKNDGKDSVRPDPNGSARRNSQYIESHLQRERKPTSPRRKK